MSFRSGRPTKRYIIIVGLVFIIGYMASLQVKTRNAAFQGGSMVAHDDTEPIHLNPQHNPATDKQLHSTSSVDNSSKRIQSINQKYCGADQCQFLLPIAITEQESKAQYHFRQLAFLSGKLGRTIVLPNVHSSHLGACRHQPFDFYYDHSWLDANQAHFNYITMAQFKAWLNERQLPPTGREVLIELNDASILTNTDNCFGDLFDFTHWPRKRFQLEDPDQPSRRPGNFTQIFMHVLAESVDVVHLYYDRRFGYIEHPQVERPLQYHARWHAVADRIGAQLDPFVAVHWRMERLAMKNLVPCAKQLVQQLPGANVFLLTDYPHLLNAKPESMSFKPNQLRQEHHDAIRYVYQHTNVSLTTLLPRPDLPPNWHLISIDPVVSPPDPAVLGIVDKLVAMRAKWFLYGQPGICGKQSSFTRRIIAERTHASPNMATKAFGLA